MDARDQEAIKQIMLIRSEYAVDKEELIYEICISLLATTMSLTGRIDRND
jgi:hypothetical protein